MGGHLICTWVATHFHQHYSKFTNIDLSVARANAVSNFPKLRKQSRWDMSDIQDKCNWQFIKVPSNNNFPILFALVPIISLCCDHVVVRKMVCKIDQTKSQGLFSNQSSDGHWETCFHLFWYSDICNSVGLLSSDIDCWSRYRSGFSVSMRLAAWVWDLFQFTRVAVVTVFDFWSRRW